MTDQYNMDQYNKETSEIHAPAELVRRTKEAVREEEQRIAGERQQQIAGEKLQQNNAIRPKHSYAKVYKWALPVAAAVLFVILYNISGIMPGRNMSGAGSGAAMDSGAAQISGSDAGTESGGIDMSDGMAADVTAAQKSDVEEAEYEIAVADTAEEDYDDGQLADTAASAENGAFTNGSAENNARNESGLEGGKNSYIESIYGSNLWIEETEEVPAFYNNPDTKRVMIRGVELYVGKDSDDTWIAYAETDGSKYIISSELTEEEIDQEGFAQAAYEALTDTTGNAN